MTEPLRMMEPPSLRNGSASWTVKKTLVRLMRMICSKSSSAVLPDRGGAGDAGVGEDDVEFTEFFGDLLEDGLAGFGVSDVAAEADSVGAEIGEGSVEGLLISAGDGDLRAFLDEETGCGEADSAVTSRNKSFLSCEFHGFSPAGLSSQLDIGWSDLV